MDFTLERAPSAAGTFYDDDPAALRTEITGYLSEAHAASYDAFAIIVPHAGHIYSGPVAAFAYKAIADHRYDTAILIGRSHRVRFAGTALDVSSGQRTPLGVLPTDTDAASYLREQPGIITRPEAFSNEHALEVNMPFLQITHPSIAVVSMLLGSEAPQVTDDAACALSAVRKAFPDKRILIVCSTDLSHFHRYAEAKDIDERFRTTLSSFDETRLEAELAHGDIEACGGAAVIATLKAAKHAGVRTITVLDARSSGDTAGDKAHVVGYLSAVIPIKA